MERINPFSFYDLGQKLSSLDGLNGDIQANKIFFLLFDAGHSLGLLIGGQIIPLGISKTSAEAAKCEIDRLQERYFRKDDGTGTMAFAYPDDSVFIQSWEIGYVKRLISTFQTVFNEEMRESATYFVPQRGIYNTPSLVDEADNSFPAELVNFLPNKTRTDWRAAGRCLAFNLLSASGFHVARAVEGMLETYYQTFTKEPGKTLKSWNDYIKKLQSLEGKTVPAPKTISELDQMRQDYRNPIMHPRVVLTEADARMLFSNGESLIICMAQEVADITSKRTRPKRLTTANKTKPANSGSAIPQLFG